MVMLGLVKRLTPAERATREGRWPSMEMIATGLGDLGGSAVGLIGFGRIGQAVAERLKPFSIRLLYTQRTALDVVTEAHLEATYVTLPALLASSSIVSLHL